MQISRKNDQTIIRALKLQNNGQHAEAARVFRQAGNQLRDPSEKAELWKAAKRAERIAQSD